MGGCSWACLGAVGSRFARQFVDPARHPATTATKTRTFFDDFVVSMSWLLALALAGVGIYASLLGAGVSSGPGTIAALSVLLAINVRVYGDWAISKNYPGHCYLHMLFQHVLVFALLISVSLTFIGTRMAQENCEENWFFYQTQVLVPLTTLLQQKLLLASNFRVVFGLGLVTVLTNLAALGEAMKGLGGIIRMVQTRFGIVFPEFLMLLIVSGLTLGFDAEAASVGAYSLPHSTIVMSWQSAWVGLIVLALLVSLICHAVLGSCFLSHTLTVYMYVPLAFLLMITSSVTLSRTSGMEDFITNNWTSIIQQVVPPAFSDKPSDKYFAAAYTPTAAAGAMGLLLSFMLLSAVSMHLKCASALATVGREILALDVQAAAVMSGTRLTPADASRITARLAASVPLADPAEATAAVLAANGESSASYTGLAGSPGSSSLSGSSRRSGWERFKSWFKPPAGTLMGNDALEHGKLGGEAGPRTGLLESDDFPLVPSYIGVDEGMAGGAQSTSGSASDAGAASVHVAMANGEEVQSLGVYAASSPARALLSSARYPAVGNAGDDDEDAGDLGSGTAKPRRLSMPSGPAASGGSAPAPAEGAAAPADGGFQDVPGIRDPTPSMQGLGAGVPMSLSGLFRNGPHAPTVMQQLAATMTTGQWYDDACAVLERKVKRPSWGYLTRALRADLRKAASSYRCCFVTVLAFVVAGFVGLCAGSAALTTAGQCAVLVYDSSSITYTQQLTIEPLGLVNLINTFPAGSIEVIATTYKSSHNATLEITYWGPNEASLPSYADFAASIFLSNPGDDDDGGGYFNTVVSVAPTPAQNAAGPCLAARVRITTGVGLVSYILQSNAAAINIQGNLGDLAINPFNAPTMHKVTITTDSAPVSILNGYATTVDSLNPNDPNFKIAPHLVITSNTGDVYLKSVTAPGISVSTGGTIRSSTVGSSAVNLCQAICGNVDFKTTGNGRVSISQLFGAATATVTTDAGVIVGANAGVIVRDKFSFTSNSGKVVLSNFLQQGGNETFITTNTGDVSLSVVYVNRLHITTGDIAGVSIFEAFLGLNNPGALVKPPVLANYSMPLLDINTDRGDISVLGVGGSSMAGVSWPSVLTLDLQSRLGTVKMDINGGGYSGPYQLVSARGSAIAEVDGQSVATSGFIGNLPPSGTNFAYLFSDGGDVILSLLPSPL